MNERYTPQESAFEHKPPPLWGSREPQIELKSEQPWHRLLLYFKAQGLSNRLCAKKLDTSPHYISQIVRQDWFQRELVQLLQSEGLPGVQNLIRGAAAESVLKLIQLRDEAGKEEVQRDCAKDLLDRYMGKAPQPISSEMEPLSKIDEARLDAEIAELTRKLVTVESPSKN
jgi:hypothetical protein